MSHISQTQKDPSDIQGAKSLTPYEFYNKYIRQEGEKVLSEEEWNAALRARKGTLKGRLRDINFIEKDATTDTGKSD